MGDDKLIDLILAYLFFSSFFTLGAILKGLDEIDSAGILFAIIVSIFIGWGLFPLFLGGYFYKH